MTTMAEAKIKAIAPWFGGKRTMAPAIVRELGKHTQYFEPFCGSMAVLFAKDRSRQETVNDLHGDLINLAWVIQDQVAGPGLYRRLRRTPLADEILTEARERIVHTEVGQRPDADRAYWYFVFFWMGRNGESGLDSVERSGKLCVRWTANGGDPSTRFRNTVDSIPAFRQRLRGVAILRRNAFEFLPKVADVASCAIYADPPYIDKSDRYLHDFSDGFMGGTGDHERLRDILAEFKQARIVLSYYDHPQVRELYSGWTFVEHTRQKHLHAQNGRGARPKEAPEVLIINGPSYAGGNDV